MIHQFLFEKPIFFDYMKKILLIIPILFLIFDRLFKFLVFYQHEYFFSFNKNEILKIIFYANDGAIFGFLPGQKLITFLSFIIIIFLIGSVIHFYKAKKRLIAFFLLLMIFGAASNLYDRLIYGFVIDYFNLIFYWWIFNIADVMIFVSAGLLIFHQYKKNSPNNF